MPCVGRAWYSSDVRRPWRVLVFLLLASVGCSAVLGLRDIEKGDAPSGGDGAANADVIVVASGRKAPRTILIDGSDLYWSESNGTTCSLVRFALPNGPPLTASFECSGEVTAMALDATHLFAIALGAVLRIERGAIGTNVAPTPIATISDQFFYELTLTDTEVVWGGNFPVNKLFAVSKSGGTPRVVTDFASLGEGDNQNFATGLGVIGSTLYFSHNRNFVGSVPLAGGSFVTITPNQPTPTKLLVTQGGIAWLNQAAPSQGGGLVFASSNGAINHLLPAQSPSQLALGGERIFFTPTDDQGVRIDTCDPPCNAARTLVARQGSIDSIAATATMVAWTDAVSGRVLRVAP